MATRLLFSFFLVSLALNCWWLVGAWDWRIIPAMLVGWYLADLASGVVHMYMDYRPCRAGVGLDQIYFYEGSRESPEYLALRAQVLKRIGLFERLVFDFKNHHPRPLALGRRTMLFQIGPTIAISALPFSVMINLANILLPVPVWITAGAITLTIGGGFAQYFHGSLHREDNPPLIQAMRAARLLMTPAAHQAHHDTLRRDFATNNGWSNPLLNPVFNYLHRHGILTDAGLEPSRR